jgi:molybdate/tungstate transport system substrate-binding protein
LLKTKLISIIAPVALAMICLLPSCSTGGSQVQLKVYNAASLIVPFQEIEKEFEQKHPDIDVILEGHGSIQVIRSVTELGKDVDIAAVADSQLIPLLMYSTLMKDGSPYAGWCIDFATNALGIAYTARSTYSDGITPDNWYEILSRPDVKVGISDPRIDSLGYRALMAVKLAETYYDDTSIFSKMFAGNFTTEIAVTVSDGVAVIRIPELLKPLQQKITLRSYSIQILALLESGDVDYAFEYESVAKQRGLLFLQLPPEIDLSSVVLASRYSRVSVKLDFQRFASIIPEFQGAPITYGVTIPANSQHQEQAVTFLQFLLGADGQRILSENYQPPVAPAWADNIAAVPESLRPLLQK